MSTRQVMVNCDALRSSCKYVCYLTNVPKLSGNVILYNSGRHCSAYNFQDKTVCGLTKTLLISSVSYFNLEGWSFVWGS